jgi:hypothetical protein
MKQLPAKFELNADHNGTQTFTLVRRKDDVLMYRRNRKDGSLFGYEVFKLKVRTKGQALPGGNVEQEDRECYPGSASFGKTAWSMNTLSLAEKYFNNLIQHGNVNGDNEVKSKSKIVVGNKGIKGRQSKHTAVIVPPAGEFTVDDLILIYNEPKPTVYLKLQKLIKENKVREVSVVSDKKTKGRAKKVYTSCD